ncbi:signal peptide peptidase SppA [Chitinispirillales bacterium ANBcel5]|uniref:signal peptide peptidase SppA n=1 Tax=Cellulosispirillum alkaliphilum TaxID=3039283 RepID=UPI002A50572F|nr:signal peptide peptidase SppA [Chitinispirillales bacterium ANBcel5]
MKFQKYIIALVIFFPIIFGIIISLSPNQHSVKSSSSLRKLGLVRINGVITESESVVQELKSFRLDPSIAGVLLRIDSQGGAVAPCQEIYSEIVRYKESDKPVVVSMGAIAASGGYYISAPSSKIFASPGTLTGSIGVIFTSPETKELTDRLGIGFRTIKSAEYKDIASPHREMTHYEEGLLQELLHDTHDQFITDIASSRDLELSEVKSLADGSIFTGRQALNKNLIDTLGGFEDALGYLQKLTGVPEGTRPVENLKQRSLFSRIITETVQDILPFSSSFFQPTGLYYKLK